MSVAILLLLTVIFWGSSPIAEKYGLSRISPLIAVTIRSVAITIILLIYLTTVGRLKEIFQVEAKAASLFIASGIMAGLVGMWTYLTALKAAPASKIVPIAACYPLVTALLSVLILREHVTPARLIGTTLIISGIWLVK